MVIGFGLFTSFFPLSSPLAPYDAAPLPLRVRCAHVLLKPGMFRDLHLHGLASQGPGES